MIARLCGAGLLLAVMGLILRSFGIRGGGAFSALAVAVLLSVVSGELGALARLFGVDEPILGAASEQVSAIARIVGAGYLFGICADICTELGEVGIAKAVVIGGRVEILLISAPYFVEICEAGKELLL